MENNIKYSSEKPPNGIYDKCRLKFGVDWDEGLVFAYGDTIYSAKPVSPDLWVHETTHTKQQKDVGVEAWWSKYLEDKDFRLSQETEAYTNQWNYLMLFYDRNFRRRAAKHILASLLTMYGFTQGEAMSAFEKIKNSPDFGAYGVAKTASDGK